jgi:hypothetical protein
MRRVDERDRQRLGAVDVERDGAAAFALRPWAQQDAQARCRRDDVGRRWQRRAVDQYEGEVRPHESSRAEREPVEVAARSHHAVPGGGSSSVTRDRQRPLETRA